ncbi:DUF1840 family protein [Curvibacter sp. CHRR-16]|uniref:DUF1840 family protein n=1 Tax=Curvibacter sp. CHRR-16 TaxID=2835872 RepID=UPI001BD9B6D9|nr:DUF1840 family protein [Curvibacter sp. CHRR-16]MBT0569789.1 DUF1840 family protein [Curvibacter sp. CHRR-16]
MLYRFYSRACADIILLPSTAQPILRLWGKDEYAPEGIVITQDIAQAIEALEQAIAAEAAQLAAATQSDEEEPTPPSVSLRQRAAPVLDLLRRSLQANEAVLWRT